MSHVERYLDAVAVADHVVMKNDTTQARQLHASRLHETASAILETFGPITIIAIRLAISALFLVILDAVIPHERTNDYRRWPLRADLPSLMLVALFEPTLYFIAENYGLQRVSASIAAIIIATIPVVTAVLARPFLGEPIRFRSVFGFLLSFGGVIFIVVDPATGNDFTPLGLVLMFAAVLTTSGYSIGIKRLPLRYRPLTIVKLQSLISLPVIAALALVVEGVPESMPSPIVGAHLLYLAIFPSSIAFVFLGAAIRTLGAGRAMLFTNLIPGITAVAAWLVVGEQFSIRKIVGMLIVVAGVLFAQQAEISLRRRIDSARDNPTNAGRDPSKERTGSKDATAS